LNWVTVFQTGIRKTAKCPNLTAHCFEKQTSVFRQQFIQACLTVHSVDSLPSNGGGKEKKEMRGCEKGKGRIGKSV